jgi:hypothetical protein
MFSNSGITGRGVEPPSLPPKPLPQPALKKTIPSQASLPETALSLSPLAATSKKMPVLNLGFEAVAPADWGNVSVAERKANLLKLQALAQDLRSQGKSGVAIWSELTRSASQAYADKNVSAARKSDFVMQDLTVVVVGGDAFQHLKSYQKLPWVRQADPLVKTFFDDWAALGLPPQDGKWDNVGWAGSGLDQTHCSDFRPQIADGSDNQVYHTLFYHFMAYTTQAPFTIHGGSIVHELKDPGTSSEDHNACFAALATGISLRKMRDSKQAGEALQDWPAITSAAYGRDGGPEIKSGNAGPRAQAAHQRVSQLLAHKPLFWMAENAVIDGAKYIKLAGTKIQDLWK